MSELLIITTGTTDVQIVTDNRRFELSKNHCGELLDQLVRRTYDFCDDLLEKAPEPVESLPKGTLRICTPKLDAVLRYFGSPPEAALILETGRSIASDPRQAGAVLEKRLRERGVQQICRQVFLKGEERLEDKQNEIDAVVRREVVCRLAEAIHNAFATRQPTRVYTALSGGIPEANDVIHEIVRLYGIANECKVISLKVPDWTKIKLGDKAVPEPFHPAASIRARWHALDLIKKGNLLAAWGAVSHLENHPGQAWINVVRWLSHFAASLPIGNECDIDVLKHPKMAVRGAVRVELALRAGDIPRAVHGTVAFYESALWDHLLERVERSADPQKSRMFRFKDGREPASENAEKLFRKNDGSEDDRKRPFELKERQDGVDWYLMYDDEACAGRLAKYYLNAEHLQKLGKAVSAVRELRNDVAHNEPTPELMNNARRRMTEVELWSENDRFLAQPIIQNVLKRLDVTEPERLCDNLIDKVRTRLTDPQFIWK